ncbi:glycosyltransferase family 2 protein [Acidisoma cellulosilytica]|uniref:Glycosyltransferase family 2 protein n=1 Tax=Acidisoma cellulosilyticum TaxID=2802395 RepID=A0A964E4S4_9PROT|nr:glycosyltransferase family 2 protein [Acidisoma cellulosilyticum]MCB8881791.1 glycosyltransferase family 2 protein [Acidisoma cellulosilyticum]
MTDLRAGRLPQAAGYDADIVILSLDRPEETEAAILSALGQTGLTRHVIVLDQGSTPENLARFARLIDGRTDALLAEAGSNLGVAGGRNRASALGQASFIIALDNDAVFAASDTAARAVSLLRTTPDCAVLAFRILNGDGSADDAECWGYPTALNTRAAERFACATFVGAGHAIRRAAWTAIGGYDEALVFTWEEFDLSLRAIAAGWRLLYTGDIAVHHKRATAGRVQWNETRWFLYVRNRLYIARKWRGSTPAVICRAAAYALKSFRIGLPGQGLRGIRAGLSMALPDPPADLSKAAIAYLWESDGRWRGGFWQRLRREVFAALPFSRQTSRGHSSVTNQL